MDANIGIRIEERPRITARIITIGDYLLNFFVTKFSA
jgi:hypothetical protein